MNMIKNHPIKGVGLDNFNASLDSQIMSKDIPPIRIDPKNFSAGFNHAHNQFLDTFAKIGIFGFLLILLLLYSFYRIFFDALKNTDKGDNNELQITDAIMTLVKNKKKVLNYNYGINKWFDIGTPNHYFNALTYSYKQTLV